MAQQFLTAQDQPDNANLELVDSDGRAQILPLVPGSRVITVAIGPGTYPNQPLVWDGISAWIPAAGVVASPQFTGQDNSVAINLPTPSPGFATVCSWLVESVNVFQVERDNVNGLNRVQAVQAQPGLWPAMFEAYDATPPRAGFLGATPVVKQSITGVTEQEQINALVQALVAFGFCTDNR